MYITLKSIKRNLGFKGIEVSDIVIGVPLIIIFVVLFCFTSLKLSAFIGFMIGIFNLLPVNISKKNRMYKVIGLVLSFLLRERTFIYHKER